MNQSGALTPSRGNKRFILLALVLGLLGAGLVYMATSRESSTEEGGSASGLTTAIVVASIDIPARTEIDPSMVDVKLVPADTANALAFTDVEDVAGQVTRFPLVAGEQVLTNKVVSLAGDSTTVTRSLSFVIPEGKRAVSITASEVQNAGGLVLPGDYVDIMVLHDVEFERTPGDPETREVVPAYLVQTLLQNIEVLAVSQTVVDVVEASVGSDGAAPAGATGAGEDAAADGTTVTEAADNTQRVRNSESRPLPEAQTVTLSLTPQEAQLLYVAEGNGTIRLLVRPFGDSEIVPVEFQTKIDLIPQDLPNPFEVVR